MLENIMDVVMQKVEVLTSKLRGLQVVTTLYPDLKEPLAALQTAFRREYSLHRTLNGQNPSRRASSIDKDPLSIPRFLRPRVRHS